MSNENLHISNSLLNSFKAFAGSHFLLNVINGIQSDVILKNNTSAFEMLQTYNRMYKNAIRSSNEQCTTLDGEINFLNDYLALEHIRFPKAKFNRIENHAWHNTATVPTYIFQSLIENALLLSLTNDAKLNINFSQNQNSFQLILKLSDTPSEITHTKVKPKVELALHRLELLKQFELFDFEILWNTKSFMQLTLTKS